MKATLTAKEAARYLGCSYWKILELAKSGELPHIRLGSRVLFRRQSLDGWLTVMESKNQSKTQKEKIRKVF